MKIILTIILLSSCAIAAEQKEVEQVNVDVIREKYWARGDESELGVVQNRLYTKDRRFEFGSFGGIIFSDPFLNVRSIGISAGFHISEYFAAHVFGWKALVSPSSALLTFEDTRGATANTNEPKSFFGAEASASVLYGKLSLFGKAIIYYDFHLLGGAGLVSTESGTYLDPFIGLGQQIYLSKSLSLRADYRLMAYQEDIKEKVIPTKLGLVVDQRLNWNSVITFGLSVLVGG